MGGMGSGTDVTVVGEEAVEEDLLSLAFGEGAEGVDGGGEAG